MFSIHFDWFDFKLRVSNAKEDVLSIIFMYFIQMNFEWTYVSMVSMKFESTLSFRVLLVSIYSSNYFCRWFFFFVLITEKVRLIYTTLNALDLNGSYSTFNKIDSSKSLSILKLKINASSLNIWCKNKVAISSVALDFHSCHDELNSI